MPTSLRRTARIGTSGPSAPWRPLGLLAVVVVLAAVAAIVSLLLGPALSPGQDARLAVGTPSSRPLAPTPSGSAASPSPLPSPPPSPSPRPTPGPTATPAPSPVEATTNGLLFPADQAALATGHVIAVMIDDQAAARPQSGLAQADIVYQAPAEGGIPRYMALFQTQSPPAIGPVRSSRLYFVAWAEEWRALYVHAGGAPNALAELHSQNGKLIYDGDEFRWGGGAGYLWRITTRFAPHNVYSSGAKLRALATRLGATAPQATSPWTFTDDPPLARRPVGGTIVVPYPANRITYVYDRSTDRYRRSVTGASPQVDAGDKAVVAPADVVILKMAQGPLLDAPGQENNQKKGRLELGYLGHGTAIAFAGGQVIAATWSKASAAAPTLLTYASGPAKGQPVPLVRGQIFIQVVPTTMSLSWSGGIPPNVR